MRVINKQAHTKIQKQLTRLTNSSMILHIQSAANFLISVNVLSVLLLSHRITVTKPVKSQKTKQNKNKQTKNCD